MSDDDSISIESNPFERVVVTDELLAYYRKIHEENPHPAWWGPPLESPSPELSSNKSRPRTTRMLDGLGQPPSGRIIQRSPSPKPRKRRTRQMLVGLQNPYPDHGLKRSPTGRVRSWRLEAQRKRENASRPPSKRGKARKRKGPGSKPSKKKSRGKTKVGSQRRKVRSAK